MGRYGGPLVLHLASEEALLTACYVHEFGVAVQILNGFLTGGNVAYTNNHRYLPISPRRFRPAGCPVDSGRRSPDGSASRGVLCRIVVSGRATSVAAYGAASSYSAGRRRPFGRRRMSVLQTRVG